jgi:hypothetical protein
VWPIFIHATHVASTERLDLLAEWHEPVDDSTKPAPTDRLRNDRAFSVRLTTPQTYEARSTASPHGGDPEHDILPNGAITVTAGAADGGVVPPDLIGVPPVRAALELAHVSTGNERRVERRLVHEFHDTHYRRIEYWTVGTSRFREYLPHGLLVDASGPTEKKISISVDTAPRHPRHVTWVPSSAPPPAPSVLYVVPTFGWTENETAEGRVSRWRRGGGLRVYLDRPWSASGYGEMLAVVLPPAGFKGDPNVEPAPSTYKKVITQWGNDPAWDSPFVAGLAPKRGNFPLARWKPDPSGGWLRPDAKNNSDWNEADQQPGDFAVTGLKPAGLDDPPPNVEIAPHDVHFDDERQLWFCDIEIEAGASYYPFVRLALARYQPCAIPEAHLSNIVLADFMALTPDRSLSVTPTRSPQSRRVTVYGDRPRQSAGFAEASVSPALTHIDIGTGNRRDEKPADIAKTTLIEIWVEKLTPSEGLDFGWHRVFDAIVSPTQPDENRGRKIIATVARKFSTRQQTRALELVKARRYLELAKEGLIAAFLRLPLWDGTVTLAEVPAADARYRIVIAEYEEYLTDNLPSPYFPNAAYDSPPESKGRRLVFVEHVEVNFE